jgi:hypothetical protein
MPEDSPPFDRKPQPRLTQVPAGSFLWRIARHSEPAWSGQPARPAEAGGYHRRSGLAGPTIPVGLAEMAGLGGGPERTRGTGSTSAFREFDRATFDPDLAGRFDPTPDCKYSYCYAAFDDLTAICEVFLRDVSFTGPTRFLLKCTVKDRQLTILETRRPLWLVSLMCAADLAAARQDSWLIHAESRDCYKVTREWAHWLRNSETPDGEGPAGIVWPAKREPGGRAVLLFGDRCADAIVYSPFGVRPLDSGEGREWLDRRLELLRTKVRW